MERRLNLALLDLNLGENSLVVLAEYLGVDLKVQPHPIYSLKEKTAALECVTLAP